MKKKIISILLVMSLLVCNSTFISQAKSDSADDWMVKQLKDYEPYQELMKNHPDAQKVHGKTEYILNEIISDQNDEIIKTTKKTFTSQDSMDKYQKDRESKNKESNVTLFSIIPDSTKYSTQYTKIKIGLTLYKYSSSRFFVACVFDWLTPPPYNLIRCTDGAIGLALDSGMSMDGTSYAGRVTSVEEARGIVKDYISSEGKLKINADSANAIGAVFHIPYPTSDIYGILSCNAYKNAPSIQYCSAFAEYDSVGISLSPSSISVSFPAGISFDLLTSRTRYTYQDALSIS